MKDETRNLAHKIEKLRREFALLPSLEMRNNPLEIEEYQHYLLEMEELLIVFKYLREQELSEESRSAAPVETIPETPEFEIPSEPEAEAEIEETTAELVEEPQAETSQEEELFVEETPEAEIAMEETPVVEPMIQTGESFNDRAVETDNSLAAKLAKSPISDLRQAFGLNERFLYANELFGGDGQEFVRALNELNHLESYTDAKRLIEARYEKNFNWNTEDESVTSFMEVVERRFLK